jgi:hypothetical protein
MQQITELIFVHNALFIYVMHIVPNSIIIIIIITIIITVAYPGKGGGVSQIQLRTDRTGIWGR